MNGNSLFVRVVLVSIVLTPAWAEHKNISPKISFQKTVCDLGRVGLSSKNTCEFKFTNAARAPLKITNVWSTCGCAVARLERQDYAPSEPGTIEVTYTAPKTATTTQKYIYVSSNDKANPKVRLTIKAKAVQIVQAVPPRLLLYKQIRSWPYRQVESWLATTDDRRATLDESMEAGKGVRSTL